MVMALALLTASLPAMAENDGWLTVKVEQTKKNKFDPEGIQLTIHLIAKGEYGHWTMEKDYEGIDIFTGGDGTVRTSMEKIKDRIKARNLVYTQLAKTDKEGKASFTQLEHGIYFVQLRKGPKNFTMNPMLVAIPNKEGSVQIGAKAKYDFEDKPKEERKIPQIIVPTRPGEHLEDIDEYETALGLGNIQMHVGVCFE